MKKAILKATQKITAAAAAVSFFVSYGIIGGMETDSIGLLPGVGLWILASVAGALFALISATLYSRQPMKGAR